MKYTSGVIILLLLQLGALAQAPSGGLVISHLTGDFYVYTTYKNFNGAPFPSNSMYLITSEGAILFDTPWDSTQFQPLLDSIQKKHNKTVILSISTHSHEDRTGAVEFLKLKGVKTFSSKLTQQLCKEKNQPAFAFKNDTTFIVGGHIFETYHPGAGHTKDNIVVWFAKEKILYGGCFVKSVEAADLGYIGEADLKEWPVSIKKIEKKFPNPLYIIPGHQDWQSNLSLKHTLKLLNDHKNKDAAR